MKTIVLVGAGAWGKNYISTIESCFPTVKLITANRYNWKFLINTNPDGIIIATPPDSHIEIASFALEKNIATMIEKPLSLSLEEAKTLKQYNAPILVNHIHLFSEAYQNLKKLCSANSIVNILSCGYSNGPNRDYSSLWDYGSHDLSLILDLMGSLPRKVDVKLIDTNIYDINMDFGNTKSKSIVGSGGSCKKRTLSVECNGLNFTYDDLLRPLSHKPPLENAIRVFLDSIDGKKDNRLGISLSLQVLDILELCDKQLAENNRT